MNRVRESRNVESCVDSSIIETSMATAMESLAEVGRPGAGELRSQT
jgi:hypothetical protein